MGKKSFHGAPFGSDPTQLQINGATTERPPMTDTERTLQERLAGPHEWGYRDPVEGGFIKDDTPFDAAARLDALEAERDELRDVVATCATRAHDMAVGASARNTPEGDRDAELFLELSNQLRAALSKEQGND